MLKKWQEERQKLATQMREMHEGAEKESRAFSADDDAKWNKMDGELRELDAKIERHNRLENVGAPKSSDTRAAESALNGEEDSKVVEQRQAKVFRAYLRGQTNRLSEEERAIMAAALQSGEAETRDYSAGTSNVGGFTVPQGFYNQLEVAMKDYGGMLDVADIIRTDSGNDLPMPTFNNTAVAASIISEGAAIGTDAATPFGQATMKAYMYAAPVLPVSLQFLQDTAFDESFILNAQAEALARGMNAHFTTGTGTAQPQGIVTASASGKVGTTGQTTTVIYDDLVDLEHSVDPAYRRDGKFMMHDTSLRVIRKIKDTTGRPIFLPGYESGIGVAVPDTLLGREYVINQDMPQMAANAKSIIFGRLDKYKVRLVRSAGVLRLTERYAEKLQVGFITFLRGDGRLLDAGTNPVKFYQNSAT